MSFFSKLLGLKKIRRPVVEDPLAIPTVDEETEEDQMKRLRRRSGLEKAFNVGSFGKLLGE